GTTRAGAAGLGNAQRGVVLSVGCQNNLIGTNADGVSDFAERNVISGNGAFAAVQVSGTNATNNVVAGNYIGMNPTGSGAVANTGEGVYVFAGATNTR